MHSSHHPYALDAPFFQYVSPASPHSVIKFLVKTMPFAKRIRSMSLDMCVPSSEILGGIAVTYGVPGRTDRIGFGHQLRWGSCFVVEVLLTWSTRISCVARLHMASSLCQPPCTHFGVGSLPSPRIGHKNAYVWPFSNDGKPAFESLNRLQQPGTKSLERQRHREGKCRRECFNMLGISSH